MPIYEYRCDECGRQYEQLRRMTEADNSSECPACRSVKTSRQLSSFAAHSGSGARSSAQLPMAGCGKPSCCMMNGSSCSTN